MTTAVLTALSAAIASLLVSIVAAIGNYMTRNRVEQNIARLTNALVIERAERDAQREYEFEARKRLYTELQPILFQLMEAAEAAHGKILQLARFSREERINRFETSWLSTARTADNSYYIVSTLHRLLGPAAIFRLVQGRLGMIDLAIDPTVRAQYVLAKQYYLAFGQGYRIAELAPPIPYDLERVNLEPRSKQHFSLGRLEQFCRALIVTEADGTQRYISYGELEQQLQAPDSVISRFSMRFMERLRDFHPSSKPVMWRIFLVQAFLAKTLMWIYETGNTVHPASIYTRQDMRVLDWRTEQERATDGEALDEAFHTVRAYLLDVFGEAPVFDRLPPQ